MPVLPQAFWHETEEGRKQVFLEEVKAPAMELRRPAAPVRMQETIYGWYPGAKDPYISTYSMNIETEELYKPHDWRGTFEQKPPRNLDGGIPVPVEVEAPYAIDPSVLAKRDAVMSTKLGVSNLLRAAENLGPLPEWNEDPAYSIRRTKTTFEVSPRDVLKQRRPKTSGSGLAGGTQSHNRPTTAGAVLKTPKEYTVCTRVPAATEMVGSEPVVPERSAGRGEKRHKPHKHRGKPRQERGGQNQLNLPEPPPPEYNSLADAQDYHTAGFRGGGGGGATDSQRAGHSPANLQKFRPRTSSSNRNPSQAAFVRSKSAFGPRPEDAPERYRQAAEDYGWRLEVHGDPCGLKKNLMPSRETYSQLVDNPKLTMPHKHIGYKDSNTFFYNTIPRKPFSYNLAVGLPSEVIVARREAAQRGAPRPGPKERFLALSFAY